MGSQRWRGGRGVCRPDAAPGEPVPVTVTEATPELDEALEAARTGAEWGLAVLYRWMHPALVRFLLARAGQDAEDIASVVWLEAARGLGEFAGQAHDFRRFLFTIAHRRSVDRIRRINRRRTEATDAGVLGEVAAVEGPEEGVLDRMAGEEAARLIATLLPRDQAEVILLRVVAGLSVPEVADILGRKAAAVSVLQHRALKRLQEKLKDPTRLGRLGD